MGQVIALAGKGGTGKTTVAALLVRLLKEKKSGSILAVDADPNSNLGESLGVKIQTTIGTILDEVLAHPEKIPPTMPKDRYVEYQIQSAINEADGFDILSLGKPEGPGCYCYANTMLRNIMAKLIKDYDHTIIDNEAGLEHLSRRTTRFADTLLVISDPTAVGLRSASRIIELVKELDIKTKKQFLLINRAVDSSAQMRIDGLECIGQLPLDQTVAQLSLSGESLFKLANQAASLEALAKIGEKIWQ